MIEPIAHKAHQFADADRRDREQHRALSSTERQMAAHWLKTKFYGLDCPDVRQTRTVQIVRRR
jgi:hypothetical protein